MELVADTRSWTLAVAAADGAPNDAAGHLVRALIDVSADRRALGDAEGARDASQVAIHAARGGPTELASFARLAQAESLLEIDYWRDARDMSRSVRETTLKQLDAKPDSTELLALATRATRILAQSLGQGAFDAEHGVTYANDMLQRLASAPSAAVAALAPAIADLLLSYCDSLSWEAGPEVASEAAASAARIIGWLVDGGREDQRIAYAEALTFEWRDRERAGAATSRDDLTRPLDVLAGTAPLPAGQIRRRTQFVGELTQGLGMVGLHEEALDALNRTITAFRPAVDRAAPGDTYPLSLAALLELRSTVLAVLDQRGHALEDAREAVDLAVRFEGGLPSAEDRVPLALRLIELERDDEAMELLDADPQPSERLHGAPMPMGPAVLALASAQPLAGAGRADEAVAALSENLAALDPGGPQPAATSTHRVFVAYGVELRLGLALADLLEASDHRAAGLAALDDAARSFLYRHGNASPVRLLHLDPAVLAGTQSCLAAALSGDVASLPRAAEWRAALEVLDHEGRDALRAFGPPATRDQVPAFDQLLVQAMRGHDARELLSTWEDYRFPAVALSALQLKILAGLRPTDHAGLDQFAQRLLRGASRPGGMDFS
jgi:hypothetical protein